VDSVVVKKKGLVGHLVALAPGSYTGESAEIGLGCVIGIRVKLEHRVQVGPTSGVNHGAILEEGCEIGSASYIGVKAVIRRGVKIPNAAVVPNGAIISNQRDVEALWSAETKSLNDVRLGLISTLNSGPEGPGTSKNVSTESFETGFNRAG
jgi:UDP-3-O-[3-hydroxymyristoyl] glucosamine N-acyltransferase